MKCPVCKEVDLSMAERQGVEIDYCPQCRGVWLDRGELDKILERSVGPGSEKRMDEHDREKRVRHDRDDEHKHHEHDYNEGKYHKKKSILSDIFDF